MRKKGGKLGTGTESFQQKFDRLFDLEKFLNEQDEIYFLEMALTQNNDPKYVKYF